MTNRLTDTELDELARLEREAPSAPWAVLAEPDDDFWRVHYADGRVFDDGSACGEYDAECTVETRDFIIRARNALPRLIAEVRELRAERAWVVKVEADARADERAKVEREIVEWIRDETAEADYGQGVARLIIDAIERGEHRR